MAEPADQDKLKELAARIAKAQEFAAKVPDGIAGDERGLRIKSMARNLRIATEFTATFLAALGLGWFADEQMGTAPWLMLSFLFVGSVVAFWDLIRAVRARQGESEASEE